MTIGPPRLERAEDEQGDQHRDAESEHGDRELLGLAGAFQHARGRHSNHKCEASERWGQWLGRGGHGGNVPKVWGRGCAVLRRVFRALETTISETHFAKRIGPSFRERNSTAWTRTRLRKTMPRRSAWILDALLEGVIPSAAAFSRRSE